MELEELKKKVEHLEYTDLKEIREDINELKMSAQRTIDGYERLTQTMDNFQETMVAIADSVRESNVINGQITKTIEELNHKIGSVEKNTTETLKTFGEKIDAIDDKGKIDVVLWLKQNFITIIGIGGLVYTFIENFVK